MPHRFRIVDASSCQMVSRVPLYVVDIVKQAVIWKTSRNSDERIHTWTLTKGSNKLQEFTGPACLPCTPPQTAIQHDLQRKA
jgi:hypothetical protein